MGIVEALILLGLTLAAYCCLMTLKTQLFRTTVNKRNLAWTVSDLSAGYIGTYAFIYWLDWNIWASIIVVAACWTPIRIILQRKVRRRIKECLRPEIRRTSRDAIPGTGETM